MRSMCVCSGSIRKCTCECILCIKKALAWLCVFMNLTLFRLSHLICFCIVCVQYVWSCMYACVFVKTAAVMEAQRQMTHSFLQLFARASPSVGHRRPTQWTHQEASCDSEFLIQFLLTLNIYIPVSFIGFGFQWADFSCLGHISCLESRTETFTWACLNPQGKKFICFQVKSKSLSSCFFIFLWLKHYSFLLSVCCDMINGGAMMCMLHILLQWSRNPMQCRENTWQ